MRLMDLSTSSIARTRRSTGGSRWPPASLAKIELTTLKISP